MNASSFLERNKFVTIVKLEHRVSTNVMLLLKQQPFKDLYTLGGFIAGGFARMCAIGKMETQDDIDAYIGGSIFGKGIKRFGKNGNIKPGDIDVFFPTLDHNGPDDFTVHATLQRYADGEHHGPTRSVTGLCLDAPINIGGRTHGDEDGNRIMWLQCVLDMSLRGSVNDVLERFDLVNCRAAIMQDGSIVADDRLLSLETQSQLLVGRSNSPMLAHRILKYLTHRGLTSVHPASREHIIAWLAQHASESTFDVPEGLMAKMKHTNNRMNSTQLINLLDFGVIDASDLVMLLGLYVENRYEKQGYETVCVGPHDIAMTEITERARHSV